MILEATRPNRKHGPLYPLVDSIEEATKKMNALMSMAKYEGKLTDGITEYRWAKNKWELMK